jgi:hypothetical protein
LQLITELEDRIIAAMEKTFSLPNSITYRNSGFGFPLSEQIVIARLVTPDIYFQRTFNDFVKNCTLYEISDGSKDITQIVSANNLLTALDPLGDSRLSNIYTASNPDGDTKQCSDVYKYIVDYINNKELDRQIKLASALLHTNENVLLDRTNAIPQLFFNAATSARDYFQQNFIINMFKKSISAVANASGLSGDQLAYADAITKQFAQTQFAESGRLAAKYLPIIKGVMLALIVGLSWIMALLAIVFMDFRYIRMYFVLLLWIMLWSPILVIINYIGDMFIAKIFNSIAESSGETLTLFTANKVFDTASSTLAWLGYLIWLVPPLAFAIAQASERGFVSLAEGLARTASQPAAEGARTAVQLGQNPSPEIRVGNEIAKSLPGGVQYQGYSTYNGHNINTTHTQTDGVDTYSGDIDNGLGKYNASFSGNTLTGANLSTPLANAQVSNALKSQASKTLSQAKTEVTNARNSYTQSTSATIQKSLTSKEGFSIDSARVTDESQRLALNHALTNTLDHTLAHNKQWQNIKDRIEEVGGQGHLGLDIKVIGGKAIAAFSDGNKEIATLTLSDSEAKKFSEAFSKQFSTTLATDRQAREGFYKSLDSNEAKNFAESYQASKTYDIAFSKLKKAQRDFSYIQENGATLAQNAMSLLYESEIEELRRTHPELSKEELAKEAAVNIIDYVEHNKVMDKLKERGILNSVKNVKLGGVENSVTIGLSRIKPNLSNMNNIKNQVEIGINGVATKVKSNTYTPNDLASGFNKDLHDFNKHIGEDKLKGWGLGSYDYFMNTSLKNRIIDHATDIGENLLEQVSTQANKLTNKVEDTPLGDVARSLHLDNSSLEAKKEWFDKQNTYFGGNVPKAMVNNNFNESEYKAMKNFANNNPSSYIP